MKLSREYRSIQSWYAVWEIVFLMAMSRWTIWSDLWISKCNFIKKVFPVKKDYFEFFSIEFKTRFKEFCLLFLELFRNFVWSLVEVKNVISIRLVLMTLGNWGDIEARTNLRLPRLILNFKDIIIEIKSWLSCGHQDMANCRKNKTDSKIEWGKSGINPLIRIE